MTAFIWTIVALMSLAFLSGLHNTATHTYPYRKTEAAGVAVIAIGVNIALAIWGLTLVL